MRLFRRVILAVGVAGLIGMIARLRGKDTVTPNSGGWRELAGPELR